MILPTVTLNATKAFGPPVADIRLSDHKGHPRALSDLTGENGILLGLFGDIWRPEGVQRILALRRFAVRASRSGCPFAIVVKGRVSAVASFVISSPLPVPFSLLADPDGSVHRSYFAEDTPALLLIDKDRGPRYRWYIGSGELLPPMEHVLATAQMLKERFDAHPA